LWLKYALEAIKSEIPGHCNPYITPEFYLMTLWSKVQELRAKKIKIYNKAEPQSKLNKPISNLARNNLINSVSESAN